MAGLPGSEVDADRGAMLVRRVIEDVINAGNLDAADDIFAPSYTLNGNPERGQGPDVMKRATTIYRAAFSNLLVIIEDQIVSGDKVVTRERWTGVHTGPFSGIEPTGRTVVGTAITIDRIENGRIVERWSNGNYHEVLRQLQG